MPSMLKTTYFYLTAIIVILGSVFVTSANAQIIDDAGHIHTIRCLVPIIMEYEENPDSRADLGPILGVSSYAEWLNKKQQQQAEIMNLLEYRSESGRFLLQYEITGPRAVPLADENGNSIPDYVELAAAYADSSWNHLVGTLGFIDPVPNLDDPLKIQFNNFSSYGTYGGRIITVHNNFTERPFPQPNRDPEGNQKGSLKVTIAHEFKHAIQFAGAARPGSSWIEMDATMAEEVVYPTVKDYLNYLTSGRVTGNTQSISLNPSISAPNAYYHATFGLYYRERFGDDFWVNIWNRVDATRNNNMYLHLEQELIERGEDPDDVFITMYLWHLASGPFRSVHNYGFNDRRLYPEVVFTNPLSNRRAPVNSVWRNFSQRSANYFEFFPNVDGNPQDYLLGLFRQFGSSKRMSFGLIAWMKDGSIITEIIKNDTDDFRIAGQTSSRLNLSFGFLGSRIEWDTANVDRMAVALVNPSNSAQMAQLVWGSTELPSTKRFGQITSLSNLVPRTEAEALLDVLVQQIGNTISTPLDLFSADVSGNGRVTVYDASLILQKGNGLLSAYPTDPNNEEFVPSPSWYPAAITPTAKMFDSGEISQIQNLRLSYKFGDPTGTNTLDDTLRVYITGSTAQKFRSGFIEMNYDSTLFYTGFKTFESVSSSDIISRNNTIDPSTNHLLKLAFASTKEIISPDTLVTLLFVPTKELPVNLTLRYVEVDEVVVPMPSTPLAIRPFVKPSDGVGIERPNQLPIAVKLNPAYPNPFNPTTIIPFDINELSNVSIDIFDILGRRVSTIVNERYQAGRYSVPLNATSLASGVYIIQMTVTPDSQGGNVSRFTQRVTLLK
jgi:hypothetical protein